MKKAGPRPGADGEGKVVSEVLEGASSGPALMAGVEQGVGSIGESARRVLTWEAHVNTRQRWEALSSADPFPNPLDPELQPLLEQKGIKKDLGKRDSLRRQLVLNFQSQELSPVLDSILS